MRGLHVATVLCIVSAGLLAADSPFAGTWKLDGAKSKFTPGTGFKDATLTFEAVGDQMKRVMHATTVDGQQINQEGTIPWDGKDHKIDDPNGASIMVAVKQVDARHLDVTVKSDGKVVETIQAVVSADGKTLTSTEKGSDPTGRKIDSVQVFRKQ
jgi:hypothetical protein